MLERKQIINLPVGLVLLCLTALLLLAVQSVAPARAAAGSLFFSEYIEGSSNNKALEIYNGTGSAVDLSGYDIQMYFNGSTSAGLTITLSGTVADGDVFVVAQASADPAILAQADLTNSSGWFNGDDAVVLRNGGAIVDSFGQIGVDPGTEWSGGGIGGQDETLRRKADVCAGDAIADDAFDPSLEWDGFPNNTFDGLGAHTANCGGGSTDTAPTVSSTNPANGATDVALDANIDITFSEDVTAGGNWATLTCSLSGPVSVAVSGGPQSYTLDPAINLAPAENCTVTVLAAQVADTDGNADNMAADYVFSFTTAAPVAVCGDPATLIHDIQGSGPAFALGGAQTIEGVVVGDFQNNGQPDSGDLNGFFVQEEDTDVDSDETTSEGIFVYAPGSIDVQVGNVVRLTGNVTEFNGLTEITVSKLEICPGAANASAAVVTLPLPDTSTYLERFEGMLVTLPQPLTIAEYFNFDRFGEIVLALPFDGQERIMQPTNVVEPGAEANALQAENLLRRILIDDGRTNQNPDPAIHPNGSVFDLSNRFRGGDIVENTTGAMYYAFGSYRLQPTQGAEYEASNPRPASAPEVGGRLKVASFNVLNYFTTIDTGAAICGPTGGQDCRGADDANELSRQRAKIISALSSINADVVGLIEIENDANQAAVQDLVNGLNYALGAGVYNFVNTGPIGADAIKVALIYKPATVTPVGPFKLLDSSIDPRFLDTKNRPVLIQTFEENATGERFTIAHNHLKSKGSDCLDVGDPDTGDGQGNCNVTRTQAAQALVDYLATDPTGSGDPDFLITGDLNSYAMEDPIDVIEAAGYTNLIKQFQGELAYSYVFDGQVGYLDHALSSSALTGQVTGAVGWHINADEPDILDYDTSFKQDAQDALYEPNAFRSSDHDPVVVGLSLFGGATVARCNGIDATIYVDSDNRIVGGPQDGRKFKGILRGTNGNDVIAGTPGQDVINGFDGDDVICGGPEEDRLRGGNGNDKLFGEAGDDWLDGGRDEDTCNGGPGENRGIRCELVSNIDAEDTKFTLTILHNNDGESQLVNAGQGLEDFGGIARFKTQVDNLRAAANNGDGDRGAVLLSSGDNYLAGPEFNASLDKGVPFYDSIAFNLIKYDAMAIGNHDFDFGPDVLASFITGITEFPFVSANLDFSLEPNLQTLVDNGKIVKSRILEVGGQKVGIVGATTPQISFISSPRNVIINAVAPAVQGEINALQRKGVKMIIVISHLQSVTEDLALAAELKGVDVMIAGGGDEVLANPGNLLVPGDVIQGAYPLYATGMDGASIPVVTTAGDYKYVGRLTVNFDGRGRVSSVDTGSGPVRVAGGSNLDAVAPNQDVQELVVTPVQAYLANLALTQIGTSEVALEGRRSPGVRTQETNLGSLMADALLWQAQQLAASFGQPVPDVSLQNGGGIRNNNLIPAGPLTELNTYDIAPFDNKVSIVPNISRDQFKEIMENAVSRVEFSDGRFAQVGGFSVVYNPAGVAQVLDASGNVATPGSRIQSITLNDGTPIVSGGAVVAGPALTVATIDFLANGGDQYPFRGAPFTRLGVTYQQALSDYIQLGLSGLVSAAQYPEIPVGGGVRITTTP